MKTKTILIADTGKVLTDGKNYSKTTLLANGRKASEFTEITDAEYEAILKEQEAPELEDIH